MVYSRNRGKGGMYEYYACMTHSYPGQNCARRYTRLHKIEAGLADLYERLHLSEQRAELIGSGVRSELAAHQLEAERDIQHARKQLRDTEDQQNKLLQAYYADAVPLNLMKQQMDQPAHERMRAQTAVKSSMQTTAQVEATLARAIACASNCAGAYLDQHASPSTKADDQPGFLQEDLH